MNVIFPTHFLASIEVYAYYFRHKVLWEAHENYQKRSIRNRCSILTAQGSQYLSIPLKKGKNEQMPIQEVSIVYDEDWIDAHLSTIQHNYENAPFYLFYFEKIERVYNQKFDSLWLFNQALHDQILNMLDLENETKNTIIYQKEYDEISCIDLRKGKSITHSIPYHYEQVFSDRLSFQKGLSIIDLLFCLGPESQILLKSLKV